MSKRFTDTEKWSHSWFRKLAPKHKCAWSYLLDKCDHAGIWIEDFEAMSFNIGEEINEEEFERIFQDKVKKITSDKFLIEAFIEFQYGNLNPNNKVHKSVMDKISKIQGATKGHTSPLQGAKDKDKEKDKAKAKDKEKDKAKEKEGETLYPIHFENNLEPEVNFQKLSELFNKVLAGDGKIKHAQAFCPPTMLQELQQTLTVNEFQKIDFWEKYFHRVKHSKFLKGLSKTAFTVNLLWLIKLDNAYKVLSGSYDGNEGEADMTEYNEIMKRLEAKYEAEVSA